MNFSEFMQTLFGAGNSAASPAAAGGATMGAGAAPQPVPIPIPVPRPEPPKASLPQGGFAPARAPYVPIPTPRPNPPGGVPVQAQPQAPYPPPSAQPVGPLDPLRRLMQSGGVRDYARRFGAGASNLTNTGGDPYRSFGQGFGGSTGYGVEREDKAKAAAVGAEQTAYDRDIEQANLALKKAADARAARTARLSDEKTMMEIKREARRNGITVSEMLRIEEEARKQAEAFTFSADPAEIEKRYEEIKARMLDDAGAASGISDAGGISSSGGVETQTDGRPVVGTIVDGWRFLGGDPNSKDAWEPE